MVAAFLSMLVWVGGCTGRGSALVEADVAQALEGAAEGDLIPVILTLAPFPDSEAGSTDSTRLARRQWAEQTQRPVLDLLETRQREGLVARIRPLWIANSIAVHATVSVIRELQSRSDILSIERDRPLANPERGPKQEAP